nr:ABC-2 family transporter protein [Frankia gtarii]
MPETKARLLDLAATRARDASEPVHPADPVDSAGSVDPGRSGSRDVPHSRVESKAQALDRRVLGDQVSPADVDRSPPAALPREPISAERKAALLDRAHERAKRSDQVAASDTDTARPADRRPPIPEKTFNHLLDGEWRRKGRPVGFHSAPGGVPPADRRLTWTGEPSRSGEYEAKVEFWDESAAEWRPKKVPTVLEADWLEHRALQTAEELAAFGRFAGLLVRGTRNIGDSMRATVRVYWRLLVAGFRRQSTYRLAALGGLVSNTTFGLLKVAVLFAAVRAAGGEAGGYDIAQMGTYIWFSQAMLGSVNFWGGSEIAERIKDGQIAVDFLRPLDVQAATVTTEVGQALFAFIPRGIPQLLIGGLAVGMELPGSAAAGLLGVASLLLAVVISAATVYLVAVTGFWLVETRGVQLVYMVVSGFLAGLFVPINMFPRWLELLAHTTPFPSMLMYPVEILAGRVDATGALTLVAAQLGWLTVVGGLGQALTRAGRHRLEIQGG